jgi:hypothetical protein
MLSYLFKCLEALGQALGDLGHLAQPRKSLRQLGHLLRY